MPIHAHMNPRLRTSGFEPFESFVAPSGGEAGHDAVRLGADRSPPAAALGAAQARLCLLGAAGGVP